MPFKKKYKIIETIHENSSTVIHKAQRRADTQSVILKVLKPSIQDENTIASFSNEQKVLLGLNYKNIIKLLETSSLPSEYIHVFEDINGKSLHDLLSLKNFSLDVSLDIALCLAQTIEYLHQNNIVHADINPKNIIYNTETKILQIIDFGHSIQITKSQTNKITKTHTPGNLFYMSPEQTGLTKEIMDSRSDLYSLGMTLYHLFLGKTPFQADDKYELLHKQIAFTPPALHELDATIPSVLSKIVAKLIEKQPRQRYQSSKALSYDLNHCIKNLNAKHEISDFEIASRDQKNLNIGEQLFGRDRETSLLKQASSDALLPQSLRVLISGHSGVGKTRLVEEFFTYFDTQEIDIIRAKFDQYQTSIPYFSFKQLFIQIHTMIMSHNHLYDVSNISKNSASVLLFIFPELEDIFPLKSITSLASITDLKSQLPLAVGEFLTSIATQERPLIIFIDDLQWADSPSIELLQNAILDLNNPYLHFVGSFRDNELDNNKEALSLVRSIQENKEHTALDITLLTLSKDDLTRMLQELFSLKDKQVSTLASVIHKRTDGNPFSLKTFIHYLLDSQELFFEDGEWKYSLKKINAHHSSINIANIITEKFSKLEEQEKSFLQCLSLLGSHLDLEFTQELISSLGYSPQLMNRSKKLGFITQYKRNYQFAHDQIQSYIFHTIDEKSKRDIHLKIGRYLEQAYAKNKFSDLISFVYHLNHAYTTDKLPARLFKLNILAIEEMLKNNAYSLALKQSEWIQKYFCNEKLWKRERAHLFLFKWLRAKTLYLNALHDLAFEEINQLKYKAVNIEEKLSCFTLLKEICVTQGKHFNSLIELGNDLLDELGLSVPSGQDAVKASSVELHQKINANPLSASANDIINLPRLKNQKKQYILSLLADYWEITYYLPDVDLMQWACLNLVNTSLKYGNSSESSFGYVVYGVQLASSKEYKKASLFGDVALKLNQILKDKNMLPKIHNLVANFINPYTKSFQSNVSLYQKSLYQSKLNGDIVFGTWANFLMHLSDFFAGTSIYELKEHISQESSFILASGDLKMIAMFNLFTQSLDRMQGIYQDTVSEEQNALQLWQDENFYPALSWYAILKAQEYFFQGSIDKGLKYLQKYVYTTGNEVIMFSKIRFHFIRALLLLAKTTNLSKAEQELLQTDLEEFESYTSSSPRNFKFEKLLLKAETMKFETSHWDVAKAYDTSLKEAQKSKNYFYTSIVGLCAGRFFNSLNFPDLSKSYFHEAIVGLEQWGAHAVSKQLRETGSETNIVEPSFIENSMNSEKAYVDPSNFQSLLKSFNAISQAQNNQELINTLMQIILENATASKAVLIFKDNEEFYIKAESDFKTEKVNLQELLLEQSQSIPKNLISYAINTAKIISLDNPSQSGKFKRDPYIQEHMPVSCLVIPTLVEGSLKALLYLENTELITPLSPESIRTLELLLTQAVIVFKNTSLYETLKNSQDNLTKAQEISHVGSWQFNSINEKIVWSAETYRIYELEPFSIEINGAWFFNHLHPDDLDYVVKEVEKSLNGESYYDVTHRIITPSGKEKIVHQRAEVFVENGTKFLSGTIQDITESKRSEERISHLSQVVDQNPFATIITDISGNIQYINPQVSKLTGYDGKELIGKNMNIFRSGIHADHFYDELWKTIKEEKKVWKGTLVNKMKNKEQRDCESTIFPLFDAQHEISHFVTIEDDVTERNIKDKLFLMQSRQAQMGEMLSMIAHQWRQPLAIISALTHKERIKIMLNKTTTDDLINNYDEIELQVEHLSTTISDFRDFFKPNKTVTLTKTSEIVSKSLALIEHSLKQNSITINVNYIVDNSYKTYESEIQQVILNLLNNAQDAFGEKNVKKPSLTITADEREGKALIIIDDNALGIDEEVIDTLFLPYVSTKDKRHGTGLGLYMCKTIIEEHCNGTINAENTSTGARFTVSLPLKDTHA